MISKDEQNKRATKDIRSAKPPLQGPPVPDNFKIPIKVNIKDPIKNRV